VGLRKITEAMVLTSIRKLTVNVEAGPTKMQVAENLRVSDGTVRKHIAALISDGKVVRAVHGYVATAGSDG